MMDEQMIGLSKSDMIDALRDLNEYVVCLDRIGSRLATGDYDFRILSDYIIDRKVAPRLAGLRRKIADALEATIGVEATDLIAEESYAYQDPRPSP
jgi:hypothetical protein